MPLDGEYTPEVEQKDEVAKVPLRIRCPKCGWEHDGKKHWQCHPGCWAIWDTFATNGECPSCKCQWHDTCCPSCEQWSFLKDWYGT